MYVRLRIPQNQSKRPSLKLRITRFYCSSMKNKLHVLCKPERWPTQPNNRIKDEKIPSNSHLSSSPSHQFHASQKSQHQSFSRRTNKIRPAFDSQTYFFRTILRFRLRNPFFLRRNMASQTFKKLEIHSKIPALF